ncbi:MAG: hypothetical protein KAX80_14080 [Planctomycetes bacterium]|nr:hypothetical protein [Planctomycetota bacterium]
MVKRALRRRFRATATGGSYDYVKSDQVRPGELWVIRSHSFENETGARGTARGFSDGHGYNHWHWEQTSPAAATLYWSEEDIVLGEGERLCVRQASCTALDELQLLINGYIVYDSQGEIP